MAENPIVNPGLYVNPRGEPLSDLQQPGEPHRGFELPTDYDRPNYVEPSDAERHTFRPLIEVFPEGANLPHDPQVAELVARRLLSDPYGDLVYNTVTMEQYRRSSHFSTVERDAVIELDKDQVQKLVTTLQLPRDEKEYEEVKEAEAEIYAKDPETYEYAYGPWRQTAESYEAYLNLEFQRVIDEVLKGKHDDYAAASVIEDIVQPSKRRAFEAAVLDRPDEYIDHFKNELLVDFSEEHIAALEAVSELFVLDDGSNPMYIANLSEWKMTKEQLRQIVNAVREASDESNRTLSKNTRVIAILPEHHGLLLTPGPTVDGKETVELARGLYWGKDTVAISDYYLKPPEARLPLPDNLYYKPPAEDEMRPWDTPDLLPDGREAQALEITTYHELIHSLLREKALHYQFADEIGEERPHVQYGDQTTAEDIAETNASMHVGGAAARAIGPEHIGAALRVLGAVKRQGTKDLAPAMPEEVQGVEGYGEGTWDIELGPSYIRVRRIALDSPERFRPQPAGLAILAENIQVKLIDS